MAERYTSYPRIVDDVKIGPPYLTKYERARIIGVRAFQLSIGAPPLVDPERAGSRNPLDIARYEVDNGILPVSIYRYLPGGGGQSLSLSRLVELAREILGSEYV
ncbi:DNA-directed RNA polymerase subunit K [Aeropyrum pernix K1]|uniref:DNA-directed RNA polymerase subunit K n=1 Tax=Aeropyrum pernix TaxID=56636 RepID=UPI000005DD37|nr:DNA-directed RNA polymerase subunit K [Aeropyrum pernix]BAA79898.1 DNA-directed RNA polymerase subunit K [Aeropyrum pernix K1]